MECSSSSAINVTINRGDFEQIFTIFKNILLMMNGIQSFIRAFSKYHVLRATYEEF